PLRIPLLRQYPAFRLRPLVGLPHPDADDPSHDRADFRGSLEIGVPRLAGGLARLGSDQASDHLEGDHPGRGAGHTHGPHPRGRQGRRGNRRPSLHDGLGLQARQGPLLLGARALLARVSRLRRGHIVRQGILDGDGADSHRPRLQFLSETPRGPDGLGRQVKGRGERSMESAKASQTKSPGAKFEVNGLDLWYGQTKALNKVSMKVEANSITALIGPSGCGKSTFLRVLDRMNDLIDGVRIEGEVLYDGKDIFGTADVIELRKRIGMVFQKPNPFPMSVYDNIAYGPRVHGAHARTSAERRALD